MPDLDRETSESLLQPHFGEPWIKESSPPRGYDQPSNYANWFKAQTNSSYIIPFHFHSFLGMSGPFHFVRFRQSTLTALGLRVLQWLILLQATKPQAYLTRIMNTTRLVVSTISLPFSKKYSHPIILLEHCAFKWMGLGSIEHRVSSSAISYPCHG